MKTGKPRKGRAKVRFRDDLAPRRPKSGGNICWQSLTAKRFDEAYPLAEPRPENRYSFRPEDVAAHYTDWPKLTDLCAVAPFNGRWNARQLADPTSPRDAARVRVPEDLPGSTKSTTTKSAPLNPVHAVVGRVRRRRGACSA